MSCKTYKELLHSYAAEELSELESSAVQKHLAGCNDCSKELQEIKTLKNLTIQMKLESINLDELKYNIMSAIKTTRKAAAAYDARVVWKLGASMIACGLMVMVLNFTSLGNDYQFQSLGEKLSQPIAFINEGLEDMSSKIINLDGLTFRIQQKIRGGKKNEL